MVTSKKTKLNNLKKRLKEILFKQSECINDDVFFGRNCYTYKQLTVAATKIKLAIDEFNKKTGSKK